MISEDETQRVLHDVPWDVPMCGVVFENGTFFAAAEHLNALPDGFRHKQHPMAKRARYAISEKKRGAILKRPDASEKNAELRRQDATVRAQQIAYAREEAVNETRATAAGKKPRLTLDEASDEIPAPPPRQARSSKRPRHVDIDVDDITGVTE